VSQRADWLPWGMPYRIIAIGKAHALRSVQLPNVACSLTSTGWTFPSLWVWVCVCECGIGVAHPRHSPTQKNHEMISIRLERDEQTTSVPAQFITQNKRGFENRTLVT
jgi:hypothetical protein